MATKKGTVADTLVGRKAKAQITENARKFLTAKITLPLGNPDLKKVHTNQFLWTELPEVFPIEYWETIAQVFQSEYTRYTGYEPNRWYIEGVDISVEAHGDAKMSLDLNAFASSSSKYTEDYRSFQKAYDDAFNKDKTTSDKQLSSTKNTTNATGKNTTLKGGEGKEIDNLVKKIIGNITNPLAKAKAIHQWLKENVRYGSYSCSKYSSAAQCLNHLKSLNCADTARLTRAMMSSAGLNAWVVHRYSNNGHFWTLIKIDGKIYASDQTGDGSNWNTIWYAHGDRRVCNSRGGNWEYNRGNNPSC